VSDLETRTEKTTYRRADGELICGDFGTTEDTEFFTEDSGVFSTLVVRERWRLIERETVWIPEPCCAECGRPMVLTGVWDGVGALMCSTCEDDAP